MKYYKTLLLSSKIPTGIGFIILPETSFQRETKRFSKSFWFSATSTGLLQLGKSWGCLPIWPGESFQTIEPKGHPGGIWCEAEFQSQRWESGRLRGLAVSGERGEKIAAHRESGQEFPNSSSLGRLIPLPGQNHHWSTHRVGKSWLSHQLHLPELLWMRWRLLPDEGSSPRPLHWKRGVLTTGPPEKSLCTPLFIFSLYRSPRRSMFYLHCKDEKKMKTWEATALTCSQEAGKTGLKPRPVRGQSLSHSAHRSSQSLCLLTS